MNYYRRYSGDYLRKTARLNLTEHGAYCVLMDYYYTDEKPLPLDRDELYMMVRAMRPEDRRAVDKVLGLFFTKEPDGYHQKRCDEEIRVSQQARTNGKGGGRPPSYQKPESEPESEPDEKPDEKPDSKPEQEPDSKPLEQTGTGTETITGSGQPLTSNLQPLTANPQPPASNPQPPGKKQSAPAAQVDRPAWLPPEWDEYEQHRREKRCSYTPTARKKAIAKLGRLRDQGHDIAAILTNSIEQGYTGIFEPSGRNGSGNRSVAEAWARGPIDGTAERVDDAGI